MNQNWSTTVTDWQGVDDVPTPLSSNLVKSGGVYTAISGFITTYNQLKDIDVNVGLSTQYRANKFAQCTAYGIYMYALKDGIVEYGTMNLNNFTHESIGTFDVKTGYNVCKFQSSIQVSDSQTIYIRGFENGIFGLEGFTAQTAIGMYDASTGLLYNTYEMAYWLINDLNAPCVKIAETGIDLAKIDERVIALDNYVNIDFARTHNAITDITTHYGFSSQYRANNFRDCDAIGIYMNARLSGVIEYGILNKSNFSHYAVGYADVKEGLNIIEFDDVIKVTNSQTIYLRGLSDGIIYLAEFIQQTVIGMYDASTGLLYNTYEMAYWLIEKTLGGENLTLSQKVFNSYDNLKYGEIVIPNDVFVSVGRQMNLWWDSIANVEYQDQNVYFEAKCTIGRNTSRGFVVDSTCGGNTVGTYALTVISRRFENREVLDSKTITIHVVPATSSVSATKNILMIGDSRTNQSYGGTNGTDSMSNFNKASNKTITSEVKALLNSSYFNFCGASVAADDPTVRNMADNGWQVSTAIQVFTESGGVKEYVEANGLSGSVLDYVTFMFGVNDLHDWSVNNIDQYDISCAKIDTVIGRIKTLVDMILEDYSSCKIICVLESTTTAMQDGYGYWANSQPWRQQHNEYEKALKYLRKKIIENFDNGAYSANVIVCSAGLWCDRYYGFPYLQMPVSSRTSKLVNKQIECVHPFDDGYKQIADGIFSQIEALENS